MVRGCSGPIVSLRFGGEDNKRCRSRDGFLLKVSRSWSQWLGMACYEFQGCIIISPFPFPLKSVSFGPS